MFVWKINFQKEAKLFQSIFAVYRTLTANSLIGESVSQNVLRNRRSKHF